MSGVDPLDLGLVLAFPAFIGSVGSYYYGPLILLALPLIVAFALFWLWATCSVIKQIVGEVA